MNKMDIPRELSELPEEDAAKIMEAQQSLLGEPVAIVGLCKQFGVTATKDDDMERSVCGLIRKNKGGSFHILYNGRDSITRQRFTVAHELAHFLLHKHDLGDEYPENVFFRGGLSNKKEIEANRLAAKILMPGDAIDRYTLGRKSLSLHDMAATFGVSPQAMAIRMGIPLDF